RCQIAADVPLRRGPTATRPRSLARLHRRRYPPEDAADQQLRRTARSPAQSVRRASIRRAGRPRLIAAIAAESGLGCEGARIAILRESHCWADASASERPPPAVALSAGREAGQVHKEPDRAGPRGDDPVPQLQESFPSLPAGAIARRLFHFW